MSRGRVATLLGLLGLLVVFTVAVRLTGRAVDDLGQLLAAAVATVAAARRSRRTSSRRTAQPWVLIAIGCGCWSVGELIWSYYELVAGRQTPFPSVADAGFLLFPVLAAAGLLRWPSRSLGRAARGRVFLDGVLVAGALFNVSWVTALGMTAKTTAADGRFGYVVGLAYPVSDLVLITIMVLFVAQRRRSAPGLGPLAVGLACICVSDSSFAYLTSVGRYATGSPVDAGWVGGFLLVGLAAAWAPAAPADRGSFAPRVESARMAMLPYAAAVVGLVVAAVADKAEGVKVPPPVVAALVLSLLVRQVLTVLDNRRLFAQLLQAQQELEFLAFHDPLTGLANRALFGNRLRHGLDLHRRDLRPLAILYCDLDGFKTVNDSLGHDAGDQLLMAAAERLLAITRPGDTVARMGGDEFAILLEDGGDAMAAAARILDAFSQPATVGLRPVRLATSIGVAELARDDLTIEGAVLLQRADSAMYQAKRNGKGTVVLWTRDGARTDAVAALVPAGSGAVAAASAGGRPDPA